MAAVRSRGTEICHEAQDLPLLNQPSGKLFGPFGWPLPAPLSLARGQDKLVPQEACASRLACRDVATEWQQESQNRSGQTIVSGVVSGVSWPAAQIIA